MNTLKPILITGCYQNEVSWVAKMLHFSGVTQCIEEPFSLINSQQNGLKLKNLFFYSTPTEGVEHLKTFRKILGLEYDTAKISGIQNLKQLYAESMEYFKFWKTQKKPQRMIIEDTYSFFSAAWLQKNFEADVLILIQHPASFVEKFKSKYHTFDFSHFSNQTELMKTYLQPFKEEIEKAVEEEISGIDAGILLWKILTQTTLIYQREYSDWLFIKHEDLLLSPLLKFREIYQMIELPITKDISDKMKVFLEKEKENVVLEKTIWKKKLSSQETEKIYKHTYTLASHFYTEREW